MNRYAVSICGGGLAGLSLARELSLKHPEIKIAVFERTSGLRPEATHKVGESTIEIGAYYFSEILQLRDHLRKSQLLKLGLRYFYSSHSDDFSTRPQFGVRDWLKAESYQIDRGRFENQLRVLLELAESVDFFEGAAIKEISVGDPHVICIVRNGKQDEISARWVVDATGRRRLLQGALGLSLPGHRRLNAAWFRVSGKLSVSELVDGSNEEWHRSFGEDPWYSTNHLMGNGYWVWLIPLASENTSVGVVTLDQMHSFDNFHSFKSTISWLTEHEPGLSHILRRRTILDFGRLRDYSSSSRCVFSLDRWSCIGDAGAFVDPYYSVGSNSIAIANGLTARMIELDLAGDLTPEYVDHANSFYLALNDLLADAIQGSYAYFGNAAIMALKTMWDFCIGWGVTDPRYYSKCYLDPIRNAEISDVIAPTLIIQSRILALFKEWARHETKLSFRYLDYMEDFAFLRAIFYRNIPPRGLSKETFLRELEHTVDRIEELAIVIFLLAVEDVLPEYGYVFKETRWINAEAIGLNPRRWSCDKLFEPRTTPRDLSRIECEIRAAFSG